MVAVGLLCLEIESLMVTLQNGIVRGYEMAEPYAEAMMPISGDDMI